ncbi:MAG: hypothetical protein ACYTXT_37215 [Nostoc sp.]
MEIQVFGLTDPETNITQIIAVFSRFHAYFKAKSLRCENVEITVVSTTILSRPTAVLRHFTGNSPAIPKIPLVV